jgi:hypothetical protein
MHRGRMLWLYAAIASFVSETTAVTPWETTPHQAAIPAIEG